MCSEIFQFWESLKVKVKVTQLCLTLCNPMDYTVHGILQAGILERVTFPFSTDLPKAEIKPRSPTLQVDFLPAELPGKPWECLLLLLLSRFSRVELCATPQMAAHQAPPSLGFSGQERWSGLPFPSPMPESETWKWSCSVVSNSERPHGLQSTRLLCPWDFPGKSTGVGCHCLTMIFNWLSERKSLLLSL